MAERKQKVALFVPHNAPGHINPSLALADCLRNAPYNYRTVFCLLGQASGENIRARGHELIEMEKIPLVEGELNNQLDHMSNSLEARLGEFAQGPHQSLLTVIDLYKRDFIPMIAGNANQYEQVIKQLQPDLVINDTQFPPPYLLSDEVAKASSIKWIRIQSCNPIGLIKSKLPDGVKPQSMMGYRLYTREERQRMRNEQPDRWLAMLNEWRTNEAKYKPLMLESHAELFKRFSHLKLLDKTNKNDIVLHVDSPNLNIYFYPKALDYDRQDDDDLFDGYPSNYFHCNSLIRSTWFNEDKNGKLSTNHNNWLELMREKSQNKKAVILFTLGSIASCIVKLQQRLIDMLAELQDYLFIISKGQRGDELKLNEANMIGANWIPQPFLLQHVDMAIVHGGNNGITECMHFGVPCIVMPFFCDQFDNAQRVDDLRLGKRLDLFNCSRDELLKAIEEILNDSELRQRTKRIGVNMRSRDDVARAVELLHHLASSSDNQDLENRQLLDEATRRKFGIT